MKTRLLLTLPAALALLATAPAALHAQTIGVSFGVNNRPGTILAATDSAGAAPYAQTHFNNVTGNTTTALTDNSGVPTTLSLTLSNPQFGSHTGSVTSPDEVFMNGLIGGPNGLILTLTNIPYASYTLVVYGLNSDDTTSYTQSFSAGGTTYYLASPPYARAGYLDNNAATPFTYTQGTSTNAAAPTANGDYAVFTGLSGASLTITDTRVTGFNGSVSGFQIINTAGNVPEPSTWALLGVGTTALGLALRRRRA